MENPYLEELQRRQKEEGGSSFDPYISGFSAMAPKSDGKGHQDFINEYACAIPNKIAIQILLDYSPILEIGAGNGYWSWVIEENGGSATPTDVKPWSNTWMDVKKEDGVEAVRKRSDDYTLFICYPYYGIDWDYNALREYSGDTVIFVGEWGYRSATGSKEFFKELNQNWSETQKNELPHWGVKTSIYVFER